ncbi:PIN domain-containing protein [Mycolicibacterium sp. XJ870]
MTSGEVDAGIPFRVVLADANVPYSRVLRDYLLYAAAHQLIRVTWSKAVLDEVVEHLIENIDGFDDEAGKRLVDAMNSTFPNSEVMPSGESIEAVAGLDLPDEGDRHVLAAAVAAEADVLCTNNIKHFPPEVMAAVGIEALIADALLSALVEEFGDEMLTVHHTAVSRLRGATDESMIAALRRAQATRTAELISALLGCG